MAQQSYSGKKTTKELDYKSINVFSVTHSWLEARIQTPVHFSQKKVTSMVGGEKENKKETHARKTKRKKKHLREHR